MKKTFLKTQGRKIVDSRMKPVQLHGVNFGGWLMMEGYILHAESLPVKQFKSHFKKVLGASALKSLEQAFISHFIQRDDFKNAARQGFNCIRLPFHHGLIETKPYHYDPKGLAILDQAIRWAEDSHLWVILDLHAAPGSQNHDWHSDSDGTALFWKNKTYQKRVSALWKFLAGRYKNNPTVAGYDILNEAVTQDTKTLNAFYRDVIQSIRAVDPNHILFIEGNTWAQDLDCLDTINDHNYVLSVHCYLPLEYTFNFVPFLSYPLKTLGFRWNKNSMRAFLSKYVKISQDKNVPIFVGEFGINSREDVYGEGQYLEDLLSCFQEFGFHWSYWTYKAIKNAMFPDGIYSYHPNSPWINRPGPKIGWDTYHLHWPTRRKEMIDSWQTKHFTPNAHILRVLKKYA